MVQKVTSLAENIIEYPSMRTCPACKESKHVSCFFKSYVQRGIGNSKCRSCAAQYSAKRRQNMTNEQREKLNANSRLVRQMYPQREKAYQRRDRIKNKDAWRDRQYRNRYGITLEEVKKKMEIQLGLCANRACGREIFIDDPKRRANVDHCHETGKIRDILCTPCNTALGFLEKKNIVAGLTEYLHKHRNT